MMGQVVSSTLVGRHEELSRLEDALLAANRGESRFVVLAGEAGIGKTRLASELRRRALKIGWTPMWGGCSEADLTLPYLPLLEALGNYLAADAAEVRRELGAARHELAQLFPQLADGAASPAPGDPTQAKLRLFESIVVLLSIPAQRNGLLLVVEDIQWADASTRELLDYIARRVRNVRIVVLVTYRSDELDRRHPLLPTLQGWRRSALADVIELHEMSRAQIGEMIAGMFDVAELGAELGDFMHERSEGNPFVLEEMLKEALDAGDLRLTGGAWVFDSSRRLQLPATVRDTILLRLQRLDRAEVEVLEAAAVVGRNFDYPTLEATSDLGPDVVLRALESAVREQLVEDDRAAPGRYRFRHALTQEAIYTEMIVPRRQRLHSRAADALAGRAEQVTFDVAWHLLAARRYDEAVPVCLDGAQDAIRTYAYGTAVTLYERALDHVKEPRLRADVVARLGEALWLDGRYAIGERQLDEGIAELERLGDRDATAHYLIARGRTRWELAQPARALEDYEAARAILEPLGASRDLAVAYTRIAGQHLFELDGLRCTEAAEKAAAIAAEAGAEEERAWALGFLGWGRFDLGEADAFDTVVEGYTLAARRGALSIAGNHAWNEVWTRVHAGAPDIRDALGRLESVRYGGLTEGSWGLACSYVKKAEGDLHGALEEALAARAVYERRGAEKFLWRSSLSASEALTEMGRLDEAARYLPELSTRLELQDAIYDSRAQIRYRVARGDLDGAAACARTIVEQAERMVLYRFTVALAAEVLVPAGELERCERLLRTGRAFQSPYGIAFLDQAEARIKLARGDARSSLELGRAASASLAELGLRLDELRTRVLVAEALCAAGEVDAATRALSDAVHRARALDAQLIVSEAHAAAARWDVVLAEEEPSPAPSEAGAPTAVTGEKLVTVMFADVRGYTEMTRRDAPAEMVDRIASLQRWARDEVERRGGIVDKFAGDAVMATFNVSGSTVDHARHALEAALALRDKAALMDLGLGVGLAVGPAIVGALAHGANVSVLGETTNLAARLQAEAGAGEVLFAEEAFRRVQPWLRERGLAAAPRSLALKGIGDDVAAYLLR